MTLEKKTQSEAESDCMKGGGHLASIHSAKENAFINKLHDPTGVHITWIGGIRDGNLFRWNDGSAFNYQNWAPSEPNNTGGKQNCIAIYSYPGQNVHDKWDDRFCDHPVSVKHVDRYVCKKSK